MSGMHLLPTTTLVFPWLAASGLALGEAALLLDLGSRLLGWGLSTPWARLWRVLAIVAAAVLLSSPSLFYFVAPGNGVARIAFYVSAFVGLGLFLNYAFPYRWGVQRLDELSLAGAATCLGSGLMLREEGATVDGIAQQSGFRCLILSDFHCNTRKRLASLQSHVSRLQEAERDAVFLLGDYGEVRSLLPEVVAVLAQLAGPCQVFAVRGNHDLERGRGGLLVRLFEEHGVILLSNESRRLSGRGVSLVGLESPWGATPCVSPESSVMTVGLCHTPDALFLMERLGVNVMFAAHTHGGLLRLPGIGPLLVPSRYGRWLDRGWFRHRHMLLRVTVGMGYAEERRPAEALLVTLRW